MVRSKYPFGSATQTLYPFGSSSIDHHQHMMREKLVNYLRKVRLCRWLYETGISQAAQLSRCRSLPRTGRSWEASEVPLDLKKLLLLLLLLLFIGKGTGSKYAPSSSSLSKAEISKLPEGLKATETATSSALRLFFLTHHPMVSKAGNWTTATGNSEACLGDGKSHGRRAAFVAIDRPTTLTYQLSLSLFFFCLSSYFGIFCISFDFILFLHRTNIYYLS